MYQQALRVAISLMLFRGGPQDMPYSMPLARLAAAVAAVTTVLMLAPLTPFPLAVATGIGGVTGVAFFVRQLLRGRKLDSRFAQTVTSHLLVGSLFALMMWPAFSALSPAMQALMQDGKGMERLQSGQPLPINPPAWAALWSDALFIWSMAASARINRLAGDLGRPASWLLTLLSLFVLLGFVLMAQIIAAVFLT